MVERSYDGGVVLAICRAVTIGGFEILSNKSEFKSFYREILCPSKSSFRIDLSFFVVELFAKNTIRRVGDWVRRFAVVRRFTVDYCTRDGRQAGKGSFADAGITVT